MTKVLRPAEGPLAGSISLPGDKSIAHRAFIFGALAQGELRLRNLPNGEDVRSTRRCLEALGARIEGEGEKAVVHGEGGKFHAAAGALDCGNSGTTMRLFMGMLAGNAFPSLLTGDASLSRRPMERVAEPLRKMGAGIELEDGHAPVRLKGRRPLKALRYPLPVPSAQVKSALLLAGLSADGETVVEDPFATRDHSERMLAWLGADLKVEGKAIRLRPGPLRSGRSLTIPGDISSAAYFLAAACAVPGSRIDVLRVGLNPARLGFVDILREMGADIAVSEGGANGGEPVGDIRARFKPLRGIRVPPERVPAFIDEAPLLAVVAALARGESRLEGLAELRHKESDRLAGTCAGLRAMGASAEMDGDALVIRGPAAFKGARVETLADHRLAMAFSIAALAARGETTLSDGDCVAISFPGFYSALEGLTR